MDTLKSEIAAVAARMVVEEGLEYAQAKHRALKQMGLPSRTALPDNDLVETSVREYIDLFCADTQPGELAALQHSADVLQQARGDVVAVEFLVVREPQQAFQQRTVATAEIQQALATRPFQARYQVIQLMDPAAARERERILFLCLPETLGGIGRHRAVHHSSQT